MYNAPHCSALCVQLFKLTSINLAGETAHLGLNWVKFSIDVHKLSRHSHLKRSVVDRDNMIQCIMKFLIDILEKTSEIRYLCDRTTSWTKLGCSEERVRRWLNELGSMVSIEVYTKLYTRFPKYLENPYDDGYVE